MHDHTAIDPDREKLGYVVALGGLEEPDDDDEFVALITEGAYKLLIGPADQNGE